MHTYIYVHVFEREIGLEGGRRTNRDRVGDRRRKRDVESKSVVHTERMRQRQRRRQRQRDKERRGRQRRTELDEVRMFSVDSVCSDYDSAARR